MRTGNIVFPLDHIGATCKRHGGAERSVFGSVLRSDFRDASDIDVLVEFEDADNGGVFEPADPQPELAQLLHRDIDPTPKDGLKPRFRGDVLASARVIYAAQ